MHPSQPQPAPVAASAPQVRRRLTLLVGISIFGLLLFILLGYESTHHTSSSSSVHNDASSNNRNIRQHSNIVVTLRPEELNNELLDSVPSSSVGAAPISKVKLHLMTFSSKQYACSLKRFRTEAKYSGLFSSVSAFTEDDLTDEYHDRVNTTRHSRGYGYWSWRPHLMLKRLEAIGPGEIIVFADAGCSISPYPNSLLADVNTLLPSSSSPNDEGGDWVVRRLELKHTLETWAKGDAFSAFGATPNATARTHLAPPGARLGSLPMFLGGIQVVRNTPRAKRLLAAWFDSMTANDLKAVSDAKTSTDYSCPHFNEHRHDQAVLSLMLYTGRSAGGKGGGGETVDVSGVRPRADDTWVPSSGGTDTSAWRALAQSGVCILATRYKECNWQSLFDEREYRFGKWARSHGWLN